MKKKEIVIFGAGGLGREVADTIARINDKKETYHVKGFIDERKELWGEKLNGIKILGGDEYAAELAERQELYGVIAIASAQIRRGIVERIGEKLKWETIIDPTVCVSPYAQIGEGNIIQSYVFVSSNTTIGNHSIINVNTIIGHDAVIDSFVSVMPSCNIMRGAYLEKDVYLGAGTTIIPKKRIARGTIIGAGAIMVKNVCRESDFCRNSGKASRKTLPVIIFGTAGAAKDIYYWIKAVNEYHADSVFKVEGFIERDPDRVGMTIFDEQSIIGCDEDLAHIIGRYDQLGVVVPFGNPRIREHVINRLAGYPNIEYPNIIHPTVRYDQAAGTMGVGNHIGPGTVIASAFSIGDFNYISAGTLLGHDIHLGNFNSINPSASIAGNVTIKDRTTIGINASVIQELHIMSDIVAGAGAVITTDLVERGTYVGIPARRIR